MSDHQFEREQRVSPLELFFDLVFVFAFTQVTTVLTNNSTWSGLGHALLLLVALWWAWSAYAWLTNAVDPSEGLVWGTVMVAMGAMFVAALAVPEAFGNHGVVFGVAFFIVAVMQVALYALSARGDRDLLQAILRIAPSRWRTSATILLQCRRSVSAAAPALYLLAYVALRARIARQIRGGRLVAAVACAALVPVALAAPALVALALVATVWLALHTYELIWWREARTQTRAQLASSG